MTREEKRVRVRDQEERISLARARRVSLVQIRELTEELDDLLDTECEPEETDE